MKITEEMLWRNGGENKDFGVSRGLWDYISVAFLLEANPIQFNTFPVCARAPTSGAVACVLINTQEKKLGRVKMAACGWGGWDRNSRVFAIKRRLWIHIYTVIDRETISTSSTRLCVILDWPHDIYTLRGSPVARDRGSAQWQVFHCGPLKRRI